MMLRPKEELPPFPENRKMLEGGAGFWGRYVYWPLMLSFLIGGAFVLFDWLS